MVPDELRYTEQHTWAARTGDGTVRVGITDYAQVQFGEIVFVQLPEIGRKVTAGDTLSMVESTKAATDIYGPLSGEVVAVNYALRTAPETINTEPYGDGWLVEIKLDDPESFTGLLDAPSYREKLAEG
ncbi:glycine cleavage system protein GcvH [Streptomyces similanensis]|uniref:Glycine cleavage system H protein n=1 Tax=Streptomyces similanensis TaxID=1274988 RepID=A0ABP9KRM9_9ACTN